MLTIRYLNPDGSSTEQQLEDRDITIGRSADNLVQLPGLLVARQHAQATLEPPKGLMIDSVSPTGIETRGRSGLMRLKLGRGEEARIGGHRLRLEYEEARREWVLEIQLGSAREVLERADALTSLTAAGWRFRGPGLALAALLLILGLLLPLAQRHFADAHHQPVPLLPTDAVWLAGRISDAHASFGRDCANCHQEPFVRVRDAACLSCHQGIKHHSDNQAIRAVAGLDERRCASCHLEHGGPHAVLPSSPGVCTDCHATPHFKDFAGLPPVGDFARQHPEFRPTLNTLQDGQWRALRQPLGQPLNKARESSGLKFSHAAHLKVEGLKTPDGRERLDCASCHAPAPSKAAFEPIAFEPHCQRCHQLDLLTAWGAQRLPHGDDELVRATVGAFYDKAATGSAAPRRRPGESAPRGAPQSAAALVDEVFDKRLCITCHDVVREPGKPPQTRPTQLQQSWLVQAHFTHAPHGWVQCADCHAAAASTQASDLLLPSIQTCRQCHVDPGSDRGVQSACVDCHDFHKAQRLPFEQLSETGGGTLGHETGKTSAPR